MRQTQIFFHRSVIRHPRIDLFVQKINDRKVSTISLIGAFLVSSHVTIFFMGAIIGMGKRKDERKNKKCHAVLSTYSSNSETWVLTKLGDLGIMGNYEIPYEVSRTMLRVGTKNISEIL